MSTSIRIALEFPDTFTAWELAQFVKRVLFNQAYELTEAHLPKSERSEKAHAMIRGLTLVGEGLKDARIAPR